MILSQRIFNPAYLRPHGEDALEAMKYWGYLEDMVCVLCYGMVAFAFAEYGFLMGLGFGARWALGIVTAELFTLYYAFLMTSCQPNPHLPGGGLRITQPSLWGWLGLGALGLFVSVGLELWFFGDSILQNIWILVWASEDKELVQSIGEITGFDETEIRTACERGLLGRIMVYHRLMGWYTWGCKAMVLFFWMMPYYLRSDYTRTSLSQHEKIRANHEEWLRMEQES